MEHLDDDDTADPSEVWRPTLPTPQRPPGVPEDASLALSDDPAVRWELGALEDDEKHGEWTYWTLEGELLAKTEFDHGRPLEARYYRGGRLASRWSAADGQETHYRPDGSLYAEIRVDSDDLNEVDADNIIEEKIYETSGNVLAWRRWERSDDGVVAFRELGADGVASFESLAVSGGGREISFYREGALTLKLLVAEDPENSRAIAPGVRDAPFPIDASGIEEDFGSLEILQFLPARLFAATIEATPRPRAVEAFAKRCPWADEVAEDAPVPHTSVANLMTCLTSPVPFVGAYGQVGLDNLLVELAGDAAVARSREALAPLLEIIDGEQALWLANLAGEADLPLESDSGVSLRCLLDSEHVRIRLRALFYVDEPDAVGPYLEDPDPAVRLVASYAAASSRDPAVRARVAEILRDAASAPAPEILKDEFWDIVCGAASEVASRELFGPLFKRYCSADDNSRGAIESALLTLLRRADPPVDPSAAAAFLRALAKRHEHVQGPLVAGVGGSAELTALADWFEREGHAVVPEAEAEFPIGEVTLPSGNLVLVDMGVLGQWSHDQPHFADLSGSTWADTVGARRGDYFDLEFTGPDAEAALRAYVRAFGASDLFDVNEPQSETSLEQFRTLAEAEALEATLERAPVRIGHGRRVRMLADAGLPHSEFSFAHANVVSVHRLPADRALPVVGKWSVLDTWEYVSLVLKPTAPVSREEVHGLAVEEARLLFADAEALAAWDHERSRDGLVDVVFWGGAADDLGARFGLSADAHGNYGWVDLPWPAPPLGWFDVLVDAWEAGAIAADFRSHSSHYEILRHVWATDLGVGNAEIGGAKMCGLLSSIGDGSFPVVLERDAEGDLCRITVKIDPDDEDDD